MDATHFSGGDDPDSWRRELKVLGTTFVTTFLITFGAEEGVFTVLKRRDPDFNIFEESIPIAVDTLQVVIPIVATSWILHRLIIGSKMKEMSPAFQHTIIAAITVASSVISTLLLEAGGFLERLSWDGKLLLVSLATVPALTTVVSLTEYAGIPTVFTSFLQAFAETGIYPIARPELYN